MIFVVLMFSGCRITDLLEDTLNITPEKFQKEFNDFLNTTRIDDDDYNAVKINDFEFSYMDNGEVMCFFSTNSGIEIFGIATKKDTPIKRMVFYKNENADLGHFIKITTVAGIIANMHAGNKKSDIGLITNVIMSVFESLRYNAVTNRIHKSKDEKNKIGYEYEIKGKNEMLTIYPCEQNY